MELSSWARVGAKCVCVEADFNGDADPDSVAEPHPALNEICTIEKVETDKEDVFLRLTGYPTCLFWIGCFRPLVTKSQEQDVAMFKSLLTPAPELVE